MWRWANLEIGRWCEARLERDLLDGVAAVARWGGTVRRGVGQDSQG